MNLWSLEVWLHVMAGITWVGLLYYFNFVQAPALAAAAADAGGPGPGAIGKYVVPRALAWFRWASVATWLTGAAALESMHAPPGSGLLAAFTLDEGMRIIGVGAWLGTLMLVNVWALIWPAQKRVLGLVPADEAQQARARRLAFLVSRVNVALSIPMLLCMVGHGHGLPF